MTNSTNIYKESEIVYPWVIDALADRWLWPVSYINSRGFCDRSVWKSPKIPKMESQIHNLMKFILGPRKFVLCYCRSPVHMRTLYNYVAASWSLTTMSRSEVVDVQDLLNAIFGGDDDRLEAIEEADLLMLPYVDGAHIGLKKARGHIANMLVRRKVRKKPTITDIWVPRPPKIVDDKVNREWYISQASRLKDAFGDMIFDLFFGDQAKHVFVSSDLDKSQQEMI
jgi:hypothetical protein